MLSVTIINSDIRCVKNEGFKLDFENDRTHHRWEHIELSPSGERRVSNAIDDFYDLYDVCLCVDKHGTFYAVQFDYTYHTPEVWQKVVRV